MSSALYRTGYTNAYAVSGSSALATSRVIRETSRRPNAVQRTARPAARRARLRLLRQVLVLSICAMAAVFSIMLISQKARVTANQKQIAMMELQIKQAQDTNTRLAQEMVALTDGFQIRNYAVNQLGMVQLTDEQTRVISMPATRAQTAPSAQAETVRQDENDIFAMLGNLFRRIKI